MARKRRRKRHPARVRGYVQKSPKRHARRKKRIRKQLFVFAASFSAVLVIGMALMAAYMASSGRQPSDRSQSHVSREPDGTEDAVIDFSQLIPQQPAQEGTDTAPVPVQEGQEQAPDQGPTESELLYEEALEKGQRAYLVECADSERATFAFAGDVLLDDGYAMMSDYKLRGSDINDTFSADLLERMRGADVFMLNNEFPFSTRGTPTEGKAFTFRADPANVSLYELLGVDVVSLANNHAYDHGEDALLDTFATLEAAKIPYVGAGRNIDEAKEPVYLVANGMKIAIVSATQIERNGSPDTKEATAERAGVLRCMDPTALLGVIQEAKANSDFVILYIHWGTESQAATDWLQDEQAPIYAAAGVDLIIGDHPHCLQKIDVVSGVPVVYSLGNFWFNSKAQDTCLVEATISSAGLEYLQFIPCRQEDCRTRQLDGAEKERVLEYMRGLSPNVSIDAEGYVTYAR